MSSEVEPASNAVERRLHPLSFLFTLISQLKQFAIPLLVLLFTGRKNSNDLWGLIGVGVLALVSVGQYFTYRYRLDADGVVIRSGLLQRSLRHIPFARIQNVSLHQTLLHRLFGVAEVRLESAGSAKPEGQMRVLRLDDAHELERQIRAAGAAGAARRAAAMPGAVAIGDDGAPMPAHAADERILLQLPMAEVLRLGLISNKGMILVGGAFALMAQTGDNLIGEFFEALGKWFMGQADALHLSLIAAVVAGFVLLLLALVALRVLSVVLAILQFHGFTLSDADGRLTAVRGLLTRVRSSLPRHRIQAYSLHEGLLHRWFGRQGLRVDSAVMEAGNQERSLRDLVPIATPAVMDALVAEWLPDQAWPVRDWRALHPRAWVRALLPTLLWLVLGVSVAAFWWGAKALLLLALLPLLVLRARLWARHSAWSLAGGLVAFRGGWLDKRWRFAEVRKLQALEWVQGPLARRMGMATLRFDTAGASPFEGALAFPFLAEADARAIYDALSADLRGRPRAGFTRGGFTRSRTAASAAPAA
jgi:putative membrane protein